MSGNAKDPTFMQIRGRVAGALLESVFTGNGERKVTKRDLAGKLGIGWDAVHRSLESLYADGIIRMEYNRIIIRPDLLQQVAIRVDDVQN